MFYKDSAGKRYDLNRAFSYNNKHYPRQSATHAVFTSLGFTQVIVEPRPDTRFFIVTGPDNNGAYSKTYRDLTEMKKRFKRETKQESFHLLRGYDWYSHRASEGGAAIPSDISTYRAAVRAAAVTRCNEIDAAGNEAALATLITTTVGESGGLTAFPVLANADNYYQAS